MRKVVGGIVVAALVGAAPAHALETRSDAGASASTETVGDETLPAIERKLAELRALPSAPIQATLREARSHGNSGSDIVDLLRNTTPSDPAAYQATTTTVSLLRTLARVGSTPAVRQLVRVAVDHGGAFRPEVTRLVQSLGDKAIPALIESRKSTSSELRRWSTTQLEGMGKRIPGDAVQTSDNRVLADVLHAFGTVHDVDAIPVILSFVNSDRVQVRSAAREAVLAFEQDAVWKLREAYANVTGKPAPENWSAADTAKELFATYDRLRLQEVYDLVDDGLKKEKEGNIDEAVAAFDKALARQPMLDRRAEMVSAYAAHAEAREVSDPVAALASLRKALRLAPEGPRANHLQGRIAFLEGKEMLARGIVDPEPFRRAIALDPTNSKARTELERFEAESVIRQNQLRNVVAAVALSFAVLIGVALFFVRRRRRAYH